MAYKDALHGAEQMFKFIMDHLQKHLVSCKTKELSWREKELAQHDAYSATRRNVYIGGEHYMDLLDDHIKSGKHAFYSTVLKIKLY